jgi:hypothetical protein
MSNSRRRLTARQPLGPRRGRADLTHQRAMTEAEIRRTAPPELQDLPRGFRKDAVVVRPGLRGKRKR